MPNKVRYYRESAGLSQEELAEKAGISRPYLSNVENGAAIPTITKARALADVLGTTLDELFSQGEEVKA